jgi:hypothetical protein
VKVPVRGISPLFIRGIPLSGNRTALSGIPALLGLSEKGNSGNRPARHQLRRLTGSNGITPSLAISHPFPQNQSLALLILPYEVRKKKQGISIVIPLACLASAPPFEILDFSELLYGTTHKRT